MGGLDVVVRAHDPGRFDELGRAIFSVAMQDYRPLAIQVVCQRFGGDALDGLREVVEPIRAIVPEVLVEVLNRVEAAPVDARSALLNLGIGAGLGRYLAFLDYDDLVYPEGHRLLIGELEASGAAIAFGGVLNADIDCEGLVAVTVAKRRVFQGAGLGQLLHNNFCPLHSFVVDRERVGRGELVVDEGLSALEDYDLLLRLCARYGSSFRLKDTIVGEYLFKSDGSNSNPLAPGGDAASVWPESVRELGRRKRHLVLSPEVQALLGVEEAGLTVAGYVERAFPASG